MRRSLQLMAMLVGIFAFDALAGRKPQDFREPSKMTEEELEALKQRSKSNLNAFGEVMEEKPKPFPWVFVTLGGLTLLVAAPFALRAYKNTSKEVAHINAFGSAGKRAQREEEAR